MAPTLKDISARISCFGRDNTDQGSIDNNKPSQIPNQSSKRSADQTKPKLRRSQDRSRTVLRKEDNSSLVSTFFPSALGTKPKTSSKPPAPSPNSYLVTQLPTAGLSMSQGNPFAGKKPTNGSSFGSFLAQMNPSSGIFPLQAHASTLSQSIAQNSQVPDATAKKPQEPILWFPYPPELRHLEKHHAPPLKPKKDPLSDPLAHFADQLAMYSPTPPFTPQMLSLPAQPYPPHLQLWSGPIATPNNPTLGHEIFSKKPWSSYNPFMLSQPKEEPEGDKMELDTEIPDNDEPMELEQGTEDAAMIEAALADLKPLRLLVQEFFNRACAGCDKRKAVKPEDVVNITATWVDTKGEVRLGLKCQDKHCKVLTCLGCGEAVYSFGEEGPSITLKVAGINTRVIWCCDEGRLAAIWALACGWEVPSSRSEAGSVITKIREAKAKEPTGRSELRAFRIATAKGIGYGDSEKPGLFGSYGPTGQHSYRTKRSMVRRPLNTKEDQAHETYFRLLALLLPSYERVTALDISPPSFLSHILSRSPLLEEAATILGNGSFDEVSRKPQLHDSVLDFFDALGSHAMTVDLAYTARNRYYKNGGGTLEASLSPKESKGRIVARDTGKSLIKLLASLAAQSETVLRHARDNPIDFQNPEGHDLLKLSERLSEVYNRHTINMQQLQTAMDVTEDKSEVDFSEWHRENCVRDFPDDEILHSFAFSGLADREATAGTMRGRMKRLITEVSTLKTALPEGIFICHGSSRLDIMKILIIGPKHTPYEHGFFEFDLYCPANYPISPPHMRFKTTNSNKARFNPNLYHDGKICLSLLGTWHGEPWRAGQSTLLQVLVSIQSMIFCEEPWYNEPGRERSTNKKQSDVYNDQVRSMTMQFAQIPWIKASRMTEASREAVTAPETISLWQETARLYLRANIKDILESIDGVVKVSDPPLRDVAKNVIAGLKASGSWD
ncbi:hypothetical protein F5Y11DRAFT_353304 [Daldinia sp. FL1419]|nr:hypothetical protein F5Y11DRAFT_353304 [Daldinia sp. FL1419]